MKKNSIAKYSRAELAKKIDEEALPFIRINEKAVAAGRKPPFDNPRMEAIKYELITKPDGGIVKKPRRSPLVSEVSGEVISQWMSAVRTTKTGGERKLTTAKRGKYNDAERIELSQPCTIERGEVDGGSGFSLGL